MADCTSSKRSKLSGHSAAQKIKHLRKFTSGFIRSQILNFEISISLFRVTQSSLVPPCKIPFRGLARHKTIAVDQKVKGGSAGLGKETSLDLAKRGAKIIIASRNRVKAKQTINEIIDRTGNRNVRYVYLDLIDLDSVRHFVQEFLEQESRLDILINNAGISDWTYRLLGRTSKQHYDLVFGVNYLGPFLLTYLLLDILKKTCNSRIINVSSIRHLWRWNDFKYDNGPSADGRLYPDLSGYSNSKLANVMHSKQLSKILKDSSVTANSVHPGLVCTDILVGPMKDVLPKCLHRISESILQFCCLDAIAGAQTIMFAAVDESLNAVTGKYFGHCQYAIENRLVHDASACQRLWDYSLKMCDLD